MFLPLRWTGIPSLLLSILGLSLWPAIAARKPAPAARNAGAIVRALELHYHSQSACKAKFLERRSEGKRAVEIESGTAYFQKPRRMRWEYESPEKKLFLTDGKYAWFFVPADHTASRAKMTESDDDRVPLALLTGQARLSRLCKSVDRAATQVLQAGNTALRCLPRGQGAFLDAVIEVDSSYRLARIIVHE